MTTTILKADEPEPDAQQIFRLILENYKLVSIASAHRPGQRECGRLQITILESPGSMHCQRHGAVDISPIRF
ncbi:MAG: hypothetical protein D4S02_03045 [Rhodocyclaceae bacterium]|nr:MAG: hypothetical protein D4S02_03045 [Rhodocyclaceae bacterium]